MDQSRLNPLILWGIINKVGGDVFIKVLRTLYKGSKPIDLHLINFVLRNDFEEQKTILTDIKNGTKCVDSIDITLAYKLIHRCCGLAEQNDVWMRNSSFEEHCLEHLLYRYKEIRNKFAHEHIRTKIDEEDFTRMLNEHTSLLINIMEKLGEEVNAPEENVSDWKTEIEFNTKDIHQLFQPLRDIIASQAVERPTFAARRPPQSSLIAERPTFARPARPPQSSLIAEGPTFARPIAQSLNEETLIEHLKCDRMYWVSTLQNSVTSGNLEEIINLGEEYADFVTYMDSLDSVE